MNRRKSDPRSAPGLRPLACIDSKLYRTLDAAATAARMLIKRGEGPLAPEVCELCGHWHIYDVDGPQPPVPFPPGPRPPKVRRCARESWYAKWEDANAVARWRTAEGDPSEVIICKACIGFHVAPAVRG